MKHFIICLFLCISLQLHAEEPLRLVINVGNATRVILLDRKTSKLISADEYKSIKGFRSVGGLLLAQAQDHDNKWGYIDTNGKWVTNILFDEVRTFSKELIARVKDDDLWAFINPDGSFLIDRKFYYVTPFSQGLAAVKENKDDDYYFINVKGEKAFESTFSDVKPFSSNDLASVKIASHIPTFEVSPSKVVRTKTQGRGKWGFIDKKGEMVITPKFSRGGSFNDFKIADVGDDSGNSILINEKGEAINDTHYEYLWGFSQSGVAWSESIGADKFTGYIDIKGKQVWEASYHDFNREKNGLLVKTRGDFQYFDPFGKLIIEEKSTWAESFYDADVTFALRDKKWGILFRDAKFKPFPDHIIAPLTDFNSSTIGFSDGLIPMITQGRGVEYYDKNGLVKYTFKVSSNGLMSLFGKDKNLIWESKFTSKKIHATLSPGLFEHFKELKNHGEGVYDSIEKLLNEKPRRYFVPNPIYREGKDPYILEGDADNVRTGLINIIAETYVSEGEWGTYEYLSDHNYNAFKGYRKTINELIIKKYGKPIYSKYGNSIWKIGGKFLKMDEYHDTGDGDFYHQLVLEVNEEQQDD